VIPATIACALACIALVIGEHRHDDRLRAIAKPVASAAFIVVGALAAARSRIDAYALAILAGLVLGAIGDLALLSRRGFLAGLGAFLLGHLAYALAVGTSLPPPAWPAAAGGYLLIPVGVGAVALRWLWPRLGALRLPVIAYIVVILAMVIAAIAFLRTGLVDVHRRELFAVGASLFFASDLAVARDKFVANDFFNRAWGLPVYYAAQLLIAWSI
jgi:uncharacterized membrane protein YhhN